MTQLLHCVVAIDKQNAEMNGLRWSTQSQSQQYAGGIIVSQHVFVQMVDTSNTTSYWHQLAIHKLADWTKLHVIIWLFFSTVLYDKKGEIFTQRYFTR